MKEITLDKELTCEMHITNKFKHVGNYTKIEECLNYILTKLTTKE